jgi:chromosome segregation ATPase
MTETPTFAGIALRTTQETWDAGLHGEIDGSEVDVGLAIDGETGGPQRVGLWVETEKLGRLALSLDVPPSGAAHLASLTHARAARGPLLPTVTPGAAEAKNLELELADLKDLLEKERADRAAALRTDAARYEDALAALRQELEEARADLARGQEERRRGQSELDAMRLELAKKGEPSPELMSELEKEQKAHEATRQDLEDTRAQVKELRAQIARKGEAQEVVETRGHQLEAEARSAADRIVELERQLSATDPKLEEIGHRLNERAARVAELERELAEVKREAAKVAALEKKLAEAEEAKATLGRERAKLKERTAELATAREALEKAQGSVGEAAALTGEVERLRVDLASAQAEVAAAQQQSSGSGGGDAEVALSAEVEKSARLLAERDEAREVARELKRAATQALAERDEARALAKSLHARTQNAPAPGAKTGEVQALSKQLAEARAVAKNLLDDKQLLETRLLGAQRQIELERKKATRAAGATQDTVTDEVRVPAELRALADPSGTATAEFKAYQPRATEPELPAATPSAPKPKKP